ncbi:YidB family protein [Rhizobium leguminosarum]|uniref:YidB family protein n=1 Tax=Rhizobium leguminosarum TaxID=384 RepID=UPI003D7C30D4
MSPIRSSNWQGHIASSRTRSPKGSSSRDAPCSSPVHSAGVAFASYDEWTKGSVMGLFDGLGGVVSDLLNGRPVNLLAVAEDVFQNAGGLDGVLTQLNQSGLSHQVASWVGTGENISITADQIRAALSSEQLQGLASKLGIDISKVPEVLAEHLPTAVDQASPNGTLPSSAS